MDRSNYQSEVTVIGGAKEQTFSSNGGETFIWQVSSAWTSWNHDSSHELANKPFPGEIE